MTPLNALNRKYDSFKHLLVAGTIGNSLKTTCAITTEAFPNLWDPNSNIMRYNKYFSGCGGVEGGEAHPEEEHTRNVPQGFDPNLTRFWDSELEFKHLSRF